MPDYRQQRSPSPDGEGKAKGGLARAWDSYVKAVEPVSKALAKPLSPIITPLARGATFDSIGFWFAWHTCGGFEGLQSQLGMSRSAIYRRISLFRTAFGAHPDSYEFPGVTIDLDTIVQTGAASEQDEPQLTSPGSLD